MSITDSFDPVGKPLITPDDASDVFHAIFLSTVSVARISAL